MGTKGAGPSDTDHLFGRPFGRRVASVAVSERSTGAMSPSARDLLRQFQEVGREVQHVAEGLSDRQYNWRPGSGRWSIAECFGHLNIVGSEMLPVIDSAIAEARGRGWYSNDAFRVRLLGRWLLKGTDPPVRHRRRAPEPYVPAGDQPVGVALPALLDLVGQLTSRVQAASGLDLSRPRVSSPATTAFQLRLFELLLLFAAHARRHLEQARGVKGEPAFPKGPAAPEPGRSGFPVRPGR